ncbi:MAG: DUF1501 domain-containing protein [Planctomycetaceae bacterium]|nr:DUF1501 domain-containing protein [Planctomycetaceae bacterium]
MSSDVLRSECRRNRTHETVHRPSRLRGILNRREMLGGAGAGVLGESLPTLLRADAAATDREAGHVIDDPVSPADFVATIYHAFGLATQTAIYDRTNRPTRIAEGLPVVDLFSWQIVAANLLMLRRWKSTSSA